MSTAPALFNHCVDVYTKMKSESRLDEHQQRYYEGSLTRLITDLGLSNPYYTNVTRALKAMDCIRQGRRGGGGSPSIWYLMQEPTTELWQAYGPTSASSKDKANDATEQKLRAMQDQINHLAMRVDVLEAKV